MFVEVELQFFRSVAAVEGRRYAGLSFGEHQQHRVVDIVIDQSDGLAGRTDQVGHEGVGIEGLSVEEDALLGDGACVEGFKYFFELVIVVGLFLFESAHTVL